MPLFDNSGRLAQDRCAVDQRDLANRNASSYVLTNLRPRPDRSSDVLRELKEQNRNLHTWDGYGWNVAGVDDDSRMRLNSVVTHGKSRIQLNNRVFVAAPDFGIAAADPCTECEDPDDEPINDGGVSTRGCSRARLSETDYNRFDPGYCPPSLENIIPSWAMGGARSRDISRSKRFQKLVSQGSHDKAHAHAQWRCIASGLPKKLCSDEWI